MAHDPYKYFRVEARELVETLGQGLLEMEKGPPAAGLVPRLLRMAHTLKGAARVVRLPDIAEMAHAVEDALAPLRESTQQAQPQQVNAVLKLIDSIGARVGQLTPAAGVESPARSRIVSEEPLQTVRTDIAEMDFLLDGISAASVQLGSMRRGIQAIEQARHLADLLGEQLVSRRATDANRPGHASVSPKTRSLAEDLRTVVARLEQTLVSGVEHIEREMRQVRDTAERLRLLPASVLFASLERTARDAAQALGKRVSFEARGGDVRLDAHVLGGIQGALIQAVRNAVAHGIEPESERTSAGKPPAGRVVLEVLRRGRRVVFQCQDDGRGIDVQAVRRVAESRGLLVDGAPPSPEAMIQILLKGGLTTSGEVTEVSGRGIGLDVVREAAARLGGDVALRTEAGRGTTLELIVPVSLSSLEALLVDCSGVAAAIPLDAVRRTVRVRAEDILQTAQGNSILHDGKTIPFFLLSRSLAPDVRPTLQARSCSVVVVDCGTALAALGVDRVFGTRTVILRPLPVLAPAAPLVAGVWLDAEGDPQILIDPEGLRSPSLAHEGAVATPETAPRLPILVVDDSLTTRMLEQSILESAGYEVEIAVSGEEALDKARRQRYRIFIVDVEMPGMDGFAFVERTRADPALREVPAILVTSRSAPDDLRRGREVGAGAYITKNEFDQAHLLETIRKLAG